MKAEIPLVRMVCDGLSHAIAHPTKSHRCFCMPDTCFFLGAISLSGSNALSGPSSYSPSGPLLHQARAAAAHGAVKNVRPSVREPDQH